VDASQPLEDPRPLVEQVRARNATPYRWMDILVWEQPWLKLKGHTQEEIDEALELARKLNRQDMLTEAADYKKHRERIRAIQAAERSALGVDQSPTSA